MIQRRVSALGSGDEGSTGRDHRSREDRTADRQSRNGCRPSVPVTRAFEGFPSRARPPRQGP